MVTVVIVKEWTLDTEQGEVGHISSFSVIDKADVIDSNQGVIGQSLAYLSSLDASWVPTSR